MNYDNGSVKLAPVEVGYRLEGAGEHNVLLLHGRNSHSGTWRKTFPALVDRYTVVAMSMPHESGELTEALVERHTGYVEEALRKLSISGATVVGNSLGGWIGMRLASRGTGSVSRLVLEDTAGTKSDEPKALAGAHIPVMIVWGEEDDVIAPQEGRHLQSMLPGAELKIVHGANHVPHWEKPDVFNELLRDFLGRA